MNRIILWFFALSSFALCYTSEDERIWNKTVNALAEHKEKLAKKLLKKHSFLKTYRDKDHCSLAHYACAYQCPKVLSWLIRHQGKIATCTKRKLTPLHFAIKSFEKNQSNGAIKIIDKLLEAYTPNQRCFGDEVGNTALHYAIIYDLLAIVYLFSPYPEIYSARNNYKELPLHKAYINYLQKINHLHYTQEAIFEEILNKTPAEELIHPSLWKLNLYEESIKYRSVPALVKMKTKANTLLDNAPL